MMKYMIKVIIAICCFVMVEFGTEIIFEKEIYVKQAQAVMGRPLTPGSVAGVARRTTRRTIRRTTRYVAVLPGGCSTVVVNGVTLHQCGGVYYQSSGSQYVIVTVD